MMHHSFQQPPSPHDGGGGDGGGVDPSLSVPSRRRVQLPVAELIESATNEFLAGQPDWSANMAVVDRLTHMPQEYGRHDRRESAGVIDLLRKKIMSKKHSVGLLGVVLLETLVKNCGSVHPSVGTRDFMETCLVKSLPRSIRKPSEGPSLHSIINEPGDIKSPLAIQRWETILKCVQAWSLAFDSSKYPIFHEVHRMLERRGVRFPPVEKEENAPVFVPEKPVAERDPSAPHPASSPPQARPVGGSSSSGGGSSRSRAQRDIQASAEAVVIFQEMLDNSDPGFPIAEDELIQQLHSTCRSHLGILGGRLTRAANGDSTDEKTMMELLAAHERVQEVIRLYEDIVAGVRKPNPKRAGSAAPQETKEDQERQPSELAAPSRSRPVPDPFSTSSVPSPDSSDLPADLSQFDLLGFGTAPTQPTPAVSASSRPPAEAARPQVDSFPPAANPVAVVAAATPAPAPAAGQKPRTYSNALPILAPPPTTATRHRKDSTGRAPPAGFSAAVSPPAAASSSSAAPTGAASATNTAPPQDDLFNLDLLMANNAPVVAAPHTTAATSPNVFDALAPVASPPAASQPTANVVSANPFTAFDQMNSHAQEEFDPFAEIAARSPPAQSGFGF